MRVFVRSATVAAIAAAIFLGSASAVEEDRRGLFYCQDTPAWPNGTYLGQLHPRRVDVYARYAETLELDPCQTWADSQRHAAVRGLRELGHTLWTPEEVRGYTHTINGRGTHVSDPFVLPDGRYRFTASIEGNHFPDDKDFAGVFTVKFYPSKGLAFYLLQQPDISGHWERVLFVGEGDFRPKVISPIVLEVRYAFGSWSVTFERLG